jgi:hypothetical protein
MTQPPPDAEAVCCLEVPDGARQGLVTQDELLAAVWPDTPVPHPRISSSCGRMLILTHRYSGW